MNPMNWGIFHCVTYLENEIAMKNLTKFLYENKIVIYIRNDNENKNAFDICIDDHNKDAILLQLL